METISPPFASARFSRSPSVAAMTWWWMVFAMPMVGAHYRIRRFSRLGTTRSLKIDYVAARNFPLETPRIEVKFSQFWATSSCLRTP